PALISRLARELPDAVAMLRRPPLLVSPAALQLGTQPITVRQSVGREQTLTPEFDCKSSGAFYTQVTDQEIGSVGCTDALKLGEFRVPLYAEISELRHDRFRA